jgi:hypothetical protein
MNKLCISPEITEIKTDCDGSLHVNIKTVPSLVKAGNWFG